MRLLLNEYVRLALAPLLLWMASCDNPSSSDAAHRVTGQVLAALSIEAGDTQIGTVGEELSNALVVRVLDGNGAPIAGQIVNFRVIEGGGSVFAGVASSDSEGYAKERWRLGTEAGAQKLEGRAVGSDGRAVVFGTFTATATAGPAADLILLDGDGQTGIGADFLERPISMKVTDRYGNGVAGVTLVFQVQGGEEAVPNSAITDVAGLASTRWRLGRQEGARKLLAVGDGLPGLSVTAWVFETRPTDAGPGPEMDAGMAGDASLDSAEAARDSSSGEASSGEASVAGDASPDGGSSDAQSGPVPCQTDDDCPEEQFCADATCSSRCSGGGAYCGLSIPNAPDGMVADGDTILWSDTRGIWSWSPGSNPILLTDSKGQLQLVTTDFAYVLNPASTMLFRVARAAGSIPEALGSSVTNVWKTSTQVMWSRSNNGGAELWALLEGIGATSPTKLGNVASGRWVAGNDSVVAAYFPATSTDHEQFVLKALPGLVDLQHVDLTSDQPRSAGATSLVDAARFFYAHGNATMKMSLAALGQSHQCGPNVMPGSQQQYISSGDWLYWIGWGGQYTVFRVQPEGLFATVSFPVPNISREIYAVARNRVVVWDEVLKRFTISPLPPLPCSVNVKCPFGMICDEDGLCLDPPASSELACAAQPGSDAGACSRGN